MPKWTEKQLKGFWDKMPKEEQERYGSYESWKRTIINETD